MKEMMMVIGGLLLFFAVQAWVDSLNPCSQFSNEPQRCSQGRD
jgi:hypothetical protein